MYDLEVCHGSHNFALANGLITSNSHSAGYSYTAYQCGWLKVHYPAEFMAAQLTVEGWDAKYDTVKKYESALSAMKIRLLPLCINASKEDYVVSDASDKKPAIRRGFKGIKGVGKEAYRCILAGQPYKDMFDFCRRAEIGAKKDVVENLIYEGAFDSFKPGLTAAVGHPATNKDMVSEYYDKSKRAAVDKKTVKESEGMKPAWGNDDEEDGKLSV